MMAKAPADAKKEIPAYAKEIASEISKASDNDRRLMSIRFDELSTVSKARSFLSREFGCDVDVYSADDPDRTDPKGKARYARPGRPAVYVE
jgi:leucyl-tRNA synthetase